MNAIQPNLGEHDSEALRRAQRSHEPSMEEILASIRAIIADDRDALPPRPAAPTEPRIVYSNDQPTVAPEVHSAPLDAEAAPPAVEEPPAAVEAEPPVVRVVAPPARVEARAAVAPASAPTVVWARPRIEPRATPTPEPPPPPEPVARIELAPAPAPGPVARIEAAPTPAAAPEPIGEAPLLSDEADRAVAASFEALSASVALQSAELVDRLTREMLRPMIKTWLDEHLPSLVERLVRAEIQRVARGGR